MVHGLRGFVAATCRRAEELVRLDHFYSDSSFSQALEVVFASKPKTLLDVGGNTGRWALRCVDYDKDVNVTIMDLPQQIKMMQSRPVAKKGLRE